MRKLGELVVEVSQRVYYFWYTFLCKIKEVIKESFATGCRSMDSYADNSGDDTLYSGNE